VDKVLFIPVRSEDVGIEGIPIGGQGKLPGKKDGRVSVTQICDQMQAPLKIL
jgi:hypothetical protein